MRAFVAVEVSADLPGVPSAAPSSPRHLTLAFLGEVEDAVGPRLVTAVTAAARRRRPFVLVLGGFGAFPDPQRPRVVFVRAQEGSEELGALAADVRSALAAAGFGFDSRPFVPHLTVLRVRSRSSAERARAWLSGAGEPWTVRERVETLFVKSSRLDRAGAVHTTIGAARLAGG